VTQVYATPIAFRRALTDRLRSVARPAGRWSLADLQRQFAYDRLLARLYHADRNWIVKGATALLARDIAVRHTVDLDLYRGPVTCARAEAELRAAAETDIDDWFRFESGTAVPLVGGVAGVRIRMTARLGTAEWAGFHVDLVAEGVRMTGTPDEVPPLALIDLPHVQRTGYLAYPLVDHIADKACAIVERHGTDARPSSRFKDLVDLVALTATVAVPADAQRRALQSEAARRRLVLPRPFDVPDRGMWLPGYAAEARRTVVPVAPTLDEALAVVRRMLDPVLDPVLDGGETGRWNPGRQCWGGD